MTPPALGGRLAAWGAPRMGRIGVLIGREVRRFMSEWPELIGGPGVNAAIYLAILAVAAAAPVGGPGGPALADFAAPGLIAASAAFNAFLGPGFSIMEAKMSGAIQDDLAAPVSPLELALGHVAAGMAAGIVTGLFIFGVAALFADLALDAARLPAACLALALSCGAMAGLGAATGVWTRKWYGFAAVGGLGMMPLVMLSGVFFPLYALPPLAATAAAWGPIHPPVDLLRAAMIGTPATGPGLAPTALWAVLGLALACAAFTRTRPLRD